LGDGTGGVKCAVKEFFGEEHKGDEGDTCGDWVVKSEEDVYEYEGGDEFK